MKIRYSFNMRIICGLLLSLAISTLTIATEIDNPFSQISYPSYSPSTVSNGKKSPAISLIEIESEDFDNGKALKVNRNAVYAVNLGGVCLTQERLVRLKDFVPFVWKLSLFEANLGDDLMKVLPVFPHTVTLDVSNNFFTDDGVVHLGKFPNLIELTISNNKLTPKAGAALLQLSKLRSLDAGCTFLGNEGVKKIVQIPNIERLNLRACGLDDCILPDLSSIDSLTVLVLSNNKFSLQGKEMFMQRKKSHLQVIF